MKLHSVLLFAAVFPVWAGPMFVVNPNSWCEGGPLDGVSTIFYFGSHTARNDGIEFGLYFTEAKLEMQVGNLPKTLRITSGQNEVRVSDLKSSAIPPGTHNLFTWHWAIERKSWNHLGQPDAPDVLTRSVSCMVSEPPPPPPPNSDDCQGPSGGPPIPGKVDFGNGDSTWDSCQESPIVIDLGQDAMRFGKPGMGVWFDFAGDGIAEFTQWLRPGQNEAFLFRDNNENRLVDNGTELFGNHTPDFLGNALPFPNGYVALAQFDDPRLGGNNDGFITNLDEVWPELGLWLDFDGNGVCQPWELLTLESVGITRLETIPTSINTFDEAGNWFGYGAWAHDDHRWGRNRFRTADIYFKLLEY